MSSLPLFWTSQSYIFTANPFFIIKHVNIVIYTDTNTTYLDGNNIHEVIKSLLRTTKLILQSIRYLMKSNENIGMKKGNFKIRNAESEKLLGVKFDQKHNFSDHFSEITRRVTRKINVLARVTLCMNMF